MLDLPKLPLEEVQTDKKLLVTWERHAQGWCPLC